MTLYLHTKQTYIGTSAERGGTTPDAEAVSVRWWETDTDTLYVWTGTAWQFVGPPAYGGISATDNATQTTISVAGTPVQITIFDTNNPARNTTPDHTSDDITIDVAGDYLINVSATVNSIAGAASRFQMTVEKNNGATTIDGLHVDRNLAGGSGESGAVSISGLATLAANDTIECWIENETNTQNYVVENINLSVVRVD